MKASNAARGRRSRGVVERLRRLLRYKLLVPVFRSPHPPEHTARGVANGVFWALTPFIGFQTIATLTTWQVMDRVFRRPSSIVQALIWAWVNNPVTMVPMYYLFYLTGLWLTGAAPADGGYDAFVALWDASQREPTLLGRFTHLAARIGIALTVGSLPFAIAASVIGYWWALRVARARRRRLASRRARSEL